MKLNYYQNLILRIALCFIPPVVFYWVFLPITLFASFLILQPYNPLISGNELFVRGTSYMFIEACIASAAYWFFWVLVLLVKDISWRKRGKVLLTCFLLFTGINTLRIVILILISIYLGPYWFEVVHLAMWKFVSGVMVAVVWIFTIWKYKIEGIPLWDDIKYLWSRSHFKRR